MNQRYLYHRTSSKNVRSIVENGLVPRNFICLSEDVNSWVTLGSAAFRIDIGSFMKDFPEVKVTTWLPESDEICVWGKIPAQYIERIN